MSIKDLIERPHNRDDCSSYLGREVYVEAFGRKRLGRVCSVYRDEAGKFVCEVEWSDGIMEERAFPKLKFIEEAEA